LVARLDLIQSAMQTFNKILVPITLDDLARDALVQAETLARHFHAEIVVLHVGSEEAAVTEAGVARLVEGIGAVSKRLVVPGDPAQVIVSVATSERTDLVVLHPRAPLRSVTEQVLIKADCPVWIVRPGTLEVREVLCGVDFTPHDAATLRWATTMAVAFDARLSLVHVAPDVRLYGPGGRLEVPELKEMLLKSARQRMAEVQRGAPIASNTLIETGNDIAKALNDSARTVGADLLVIGRRPSPGILGKHCYAIARASTVPVLSVN
jgi:nucleotide-binding universal stress UspA family protein